MSDDLTVLGVDGIRRSYDEHYDTMMDVEQDPTGAFFAIQRQAYRIEELEAKLDWVITERDETFALMLDRAQTAEAKLAETVEALDVDLIEQAISDVLSEGGTIRDAAEYVARTTLAELKGRDDA